MSQKIGLDRLLDYLAAGPSFKKITITPLKDALEGDAERFALTIDGGPLSGWQVYRGESIEQALNMYLRDLINDVRKTINYKTQELSTLVNIEI